MKHLREELWFNTPNRRDYLNITDKVEALRAGTHAGDPQRGGASVERPVRAGHIAVVQVAGVEGRVERRLGDAVQGDLGNSERSDASVQAMLQKAMWYTVQLIFWGILVSAIVAFRAVCNVKCSVVTADRRAAPIQNFAAFISILRKSH